VRPWSAADWGAYYDERAGIAEFDGGLPRPRAEKRAFDCCVAEWLDRNLASSDAKDSCPMCGDGDRPGDDLLPTGIGTGLGLTWLHRDCVPAWRSARMDAAVEALRVMGITGPSAES
jgi:hypothetical protein